VLVEDQGRVNYEIRLGEAKGLVGPVTLGGHELSGWSAQAVDLATVAAGIPDGSEQPTAGRIGLAGTFDLDEPTDLFLDTDAWSKGYAFVNGFFLGRYWRNGPQRTLYVPAPATRAGANEIVVVELEHVIEPVAAFVAEPDLGHREE